MNQYSEYSSKLGNYIKLPIGLIILIALIILFLVFLCMKVKYKSMAVTAFISGVAIILIIYLFSIFPYQKDISSNSYEQYKGSFTVEKYYYINRGGTYILIKFGEQDAVRYKVLTDMPPIENGTTYNGTVVFSKNSRCLVDIDLNKS